MFYKKKSSLAPSVSKQSTSSLVRCGGAKESKVGVKNQEWGQVKSTSRRSQKCHLHSVAVETRAVSRLGSHRPTSVGVCPLHTAAATTREKEVFRVQRLSRAKKEGRESLYFRQREPKNIKCSRLHDTNQCRNKTGQDKTRHARSWSWSWSWWSSFAPKRRDRRHITTKRNPPPSYPLSAPSQRGGEVVHSGTPPSHC